MRPLLALALSALLSLPVMAHEYTAGTLKITHPWSRAMPAASPGAAVYLNISNQGSEADRLLAVSTPYAPAAELHNNIHDNGVMRMRPLPAGIELPAGATVKLAPGGLHIMLSGIKNQAGNGASFPLQLQFEHAGKIQVEVKVEEHSHD